MFKWLFKKRIKLTTVAVGTGHQTLCNTYLNTERMEAIYAFLKENFSLEYYYDFDEITLKFNNNPNLVHVVHDGVAMRVIETIIEV